MEIITGYTSENHVTSADDASLYRGILGQDDYVLETGSKFAATIIDNNTVRIMDGDLLIQGHQARIRANDYNEVTIDNGTPGQKRNDLIVARYIKNTETGIESITLEVVKGTPGAAAIDPEIIQGDLKVGGTQRDYPLYRVALDGISLTNLTTLFNVVPTIASHLAESARKHITESGTNPNGSYIRFDDGTMICLHTESIGYGDLEIGEHTRLWDYPSSFVNNNNVYLPVLAFPVAGRISRMTCSPRRGDYNTRFQATAFIVVTQAMDSATNLNHFAIGRWK